VKWVGYVAYMGKHELHKDLRYENLMGKSVWKMAWSGKIRDSRFSG
jgi:hypothetical protein